MRCFTYVVARDYGFAPNPFGGYCTLATCKPLIRAKASKGDWIIGIGSKRYKLHKNLIFAMEVTEKLTFNEYWHDKRFQYKKPVFNGSLMQAYGDNIYFRNTEDKTWYQEDSHHSNEDGSINLANLTKDTKADAVLISENFYYFGDTAPVLPDGLNNEVCHRRNHNRIENEDVIRELIDWIQTQGEKNVLMGFPYSFRSKGFKRYKGT